MIGKMNLGSGGGIDLDGIIEQYKVASGGNINAGNFVKYIGYETEGSGINIINSTRTNADTCHIDNDDCLRGLFPLLVNENTVLLIYFSYSSTISAIVITFTGTGTYSYGKATEIASESSSMANATVAVEQIDSTHYMFTYTYSKNIYYSVITVNVNSSTITVGTKKTLDTAYNSDCMNVLKIDNKILFLYYSNNYQFCINVGTISNGDIASFSKFEFGQTQSNYINTIKRSDNEIFVIDQNSNFKQSTYKYENNQVTLLSAINKKITDTNLLPYLKVDRLYNYFITEDFLVNMYDGIITLYQVTETDIIEKAKLQYATNVALTRESVFHLGDNQILFVVCTTNNRNYEHYYEYYIEDNVIAYILTINAEEFKINISAPTILNTFTTRSGTSSNYEDNSAALLYNQTNKQFVVFNPYSGKSTSSKDYLGNYAINMTKFNVDLDEVVNTAYKGDIILGIAKQKGTEGQTIDVYVPNVQ